MPATLRNLNLNTSIAAGDALDYHQVEQAKNLATSLRGLRGEFTLLRHLRLSPFCRLLI